MILDITINHNEYILFKSNELKWQVIVHFVEIGEIDFIFVSRQCNIWIKNKNKYLFYSFLPVWFQQLFQNFIFFKFVEVDATMIFVAYFKHDFFFVASYAIWNELSLMGNTDHYMLFMNSSLSLRGSNLFTAHYFNLLNIYLL